MATRRRPRRLFVRPRFEGLESRRLLATVITVNTNGDPAPPSSPPTQPLTQISLREAIMVADGTLPASYFASSVISGSGSPTTINFNLPGGSTTISPTSFLPGLTAAMTIDGTSQPGYAGTPVVVLNGTSVGSGGDGFDVNASGVTIQGLDIVNFSGTGIVIGQAGGRDRVSSCYIGVAVDGRTAAPNKVDGILISNSSASTIGGTSTTGNVISGNQYYGIDVAGGSANVISFDRVGTSADGTTAVPNCTAGVPGIAGIGEQTSTGLLVSNCVVSGNSQFGVSFSSGSANILAASLVGVDATGEKALANAAGGVNDQSESGDFIGLSGGANINVISGNNGPGVLLNAARNAAVSNSFIGLDRAGTKAIGNSGDGVLVANGSSGSTIGGALGLGNFISGNIGSTATGVGNGVDIQSGSTGTVVQGDDIGSDVNGKAVAGLANSLNGVQFFQTSGTVLGCGIIENGQSGILLYGGSGSSIRGNQIGDVRSGVQGNHVDGVFIYASSNNTIGGVGGGNIIASNGSLGGNQGGNPTPTSGFGIEVQSDLTDSPNVLASKNVIQANFVGLDIVGNPTRANANGIGVFDAPGTTIGGSAGGTANWVGANKGYGIDVSGANSTAAVIQGNTVGPVPSVTPTPAPNGAGGIVLDTVTGALVAGNIVSANAVDGIYVLNGSGSVLQTNLIGTDLFGTAPEGNGADGIDIVGASGTTIGGSADSTRNTISANKGYGIQISGGAKNTFISADWIGVGLNGNGGTSMGNTQSGIWVDNVAGTTIGGSIQSHNIISNSGADGVLITGANSTNTAVLANFIGTRSDGVTAAPNALDGVLVQGSNYANVSFNLISGNTDYGVHVAQGATGAVLAGNKIGLTLLATSPLPNGLAGVALDNVAGNTIGGTVAAARNFISGNKLDGVFISGTGGTNNVVEGNYIGTDFFGVAAVPNGVDGVLVQGPGNVIGGGGGASTRNVISGNGYAGVDLAIGGSNNVVAGNYIGTDATGGLPIGNAYYGVEVDGSSSTAASNNKIGLGNAAGQNLISANGVGNVYLLGPLSNGTLVAGNLIGTNLAVTLGLAATPYGVLISGSPNDTIGGTAAGAGNTISGAGTVGLEILNSGASGNLVQGNLIGGAPNLSPTLANAVGVIINGAPNNTVGGSAAGAGNTIVGNKSNPIQVTGSGATGNVTTGNNVGP